jgi:hypothetical protein
MCTAAEVLNLTVTHGNQQISYRQNNLFWCFFPLEWYELYNESNGHKIPGADGCTADQSIELDSYTETNEYHYRQNNLFWLLLSFGMN